jgi:negative regulator of flagellin synthesis FlgM
MASGIDQVNAGSAGTNSAGTNSAGTNSAGIGVAGSGSTEQVRRTGSPATTTTAAEPAAPADCVSITDSARLLASLSTAVADSPRIDQARVESLRRALESGQYHISAARIADGLLAMERNLGGQAT